MRIKLLCSKFNGNSVGRSSTAGTTLATHLPWEFRIAIFDATPASTVPSKHRVTSHLLTHALAETSLQPKN